MSNGRLRLELSDAGSRFRVGGMKGRIRASTGKSTFKIVMVCLIWSVRMVHSVAASGQAECAINPDEGALWVAQRMAWSLLSVLARHPDVVDAVVRREARVAVRWPWPAAADGSVEDEVE